VRSGVTIDVGSITRETAMGMRARRSGHLDEDPSPFRAHEKPGCFPGGLRLMTKAKTILQGLKPELIERGLWHG